LPDLHVFTVPAETAGSAKAWNKHSIGNADWFTTTADYSLFATADILLAYG